MSLYLRQAPLSPMTCLSNMEGHLPSPRKADSQQASTQGPAAFQGQLLVWHLLPLNGEVLEWVWTGSCAGLLPTTLLCHIHPILAGVWSCIIRTPLPYLAGVLVLY